MTSSLAFTPLTEVPDLSAADRKRDARLAFHKALLSVEAMGVDHNPWHLLRNEVWPKWHDAMYPNPDLRSPSGLATGRYQSYSESRNKNERQRLAGDEILGAWAKKCQLVETRVDGSLQPAGWIVELARKQCQEWHPEYRDPTDSIQTTFGLGTKRMPPPIGSGWLLVPMDDPERLPGELQESFRKRVRKAVTRYLHQLERPESREWVAPRSTQSKVKLDHYEWVVLYQCCGWTLEKIRLKYPHLDSKQAVSLGINGKATLLGLRVRTKSRNRS